MKKIAFVFVLMSCLVMNAQAEVAKYCMSFNDLIENNWKSVDELTQGRANQVCQIKTSEKQVRFKTGVKDVDKMLKKEAFAVMVGNQLYVNCRNMRNNSQSLDVNGFTPAVRYDNDKICIMAYKADKAMFALSLGMAFAGDFIDNRAVRFGMWTGSTAAWITSDMLSGKVCYLVDGNTDDKGMLSATRMNDKFMENLLANDAPLLQKYKGIGNKHNRQSAANVLPILMEKGLVSM